MIFTLNFYFPESVLQPSSHTTLTLKLGINFHIAFLRYEYFLLLYPQVIGTSMKNHFNSLTMSIAHVYIQSIHHTEVM